LVVEPSVTVAPTFAPGLVIVAVGAVLSTRTIATAELVVWLPASSVATTRTAWRPSETPVVSQLVPPRVVQLPSPAGDNWYTVQSTPHSASLVVEASVTVARTFAPGLVIVAVGAVLSTRTFATVALVVTLPAPSV